MSERDRGDVEEPGVELRLFVTNEGSLSRLHVGGEIDMASVRALSERLELLIQSGTGNVRSRCPTSRSATQRDSRPWSSPTTISAPAIGC